MERQAFAEIVTPDEAGRLAAIHRYDILDTPPDGAFDRIAALAARILGTPIATITIVDHDRIWFKAKHGLDAEQVDRAPGLCASAILQDEAYVVTDALLDPRTFENPLVAGAMGVRFYAGAPLITADGYRLGTVNVIDSRPRSITGEQIQTLQDLAAVVVDELELRLAARRVMEARAEVERLGEALQRSSRPPTFPDIPGLEIAAYYRPSNAGLGICGDFYDVFETRPGTWAVAIGDVCGKGVDAAVMMSSVRHRVQALASAGLRPSDLLGRLNSSLLREATDLTFCTICYIEVRPTDPRAHLRISCGGHPLPLLRRADGSVCAAGKPGTLIGAIADASQTDTFEELDAGDMLLLFTDGVIERRTISSHEAEDLLRGALANCPSDGSAEEVLQIISERLPEPLEGLLDDAAMLLLKKS